MMAIKSDLFERVRSERFDQIYANGPFIEGNIQEPLDYACYGAKTFIEKIFRDIRKYLKTNGKLLIVIATWADLEHFKMTAKDNKLSTSLIDTKQSSDKKRTYNLYEVRPL